MYGQMDFSRTVSRTNLAAKKGQINDVNKSEETMATKCRNDQTITYVHKSLSVRLSVRQKYFNLAHIF